MKGLDYYTTKAEDIPGTHSNIGTFGCHGEDYDIRVVYFPYCAAAPFGHSHLVPATLMEDLRRKLRTTTLRADGLSVKHVTFDAKETYLLYGPDIISSFDLFDGQDNNAIFLYFGDAGCYIGDASSLYVATDAARNHYKPLIDEKESGHECA